MLNKKITDILAYITPIGLIAAFLIGDRKNSKFHINQALVIWLVGVLAGLVLGFLTGFPLIGWIFKIIGWGVEVFCFLCWFIGLMGAIFGTEKPVPVLGGIQLYR